ncbi:hypothetical protein OAP18_01735 [Gammaproteobacteria bacterium]|nr:hypothetical protein [Gammaproteobacteria bacterium]
MSIFNKHNKSLIIFMGFLFISLASFTQTANADCPGFDNSDQGSTLRYVDCTEDQDNNGGNINIGSPPATVAGDLLVLAIATDGNQGIGVPGGWNEISDVNSGGAVTLRVWTRVATGADNAAFFVPNNEDTYAWMMLFTGHNGVGALTTNTGQSNNAASPAVTPTEANSYILRLAAGDDDDGTNDDDPVIAGHISITQQQSAGGNGTTSGSAAYVNQVGLGSSGTANFASFPGGNEQWSTATLVIRPFVPPIPSFSISHLGSGETCAEHVITIQALDAAGVLDTTYTGTINISTDTGNGYWAVDPSGGNGNGSFTSGSGVGSSSYTFVGADNGQIILRYFNANAETVNFDVSDGTFTESVDPSLVISACSSTTPSTFNLQCENNTDGSVNIGIDSRVNNSNRLVVVAIGSEGNPVFPTTVTFDPGGTNAAMTLLGRGYVNDGNNDALSELWAILDADLPAGAGSFTVTHNGAGPDGAMCALSFIDVEQSFGLTGVTAPNGGGGVVNVNYEVDNAVAGVPSPADNTISTDITTASTGSLVVSIVENGLNGTYTTQLAEQFDAAPGGQGAVVAVGAEVIGPAGALTVTDVASVDTNRQAQVVAAFSPIPLTANQFAITHNNVGGVCTANLVTVSAVNALGQIDPGYTGTITISGNTGIGNWVLNTGGGAFTNLGSGSATYTFVPADNGQVVLGFDQGVPGTVNFNVTDGSFTESIFFDNDLVIGDCQYRIVHSGFGSTCAPETISIGMYDGSGNVLTSFTGTINLSTSTGNGSWGVPAIGDVPLGTLNDPSGNDGLATYTFVAGDNGIVDLNFSDISAETVNINITGGGFTVDPLFDPDLVVTPCSFRITHSGTSDICSLEAVTISTVDGFGNPVTGYTGTINLTTSTGNGTWSLNTGAGTFNDPVANDGAASYVFDVTDGGVAVVNYANPNVEIININVTDGSVSEDAGFDANLSLSLCSFRITAATGSLTTCTSDTITFEVFDSGGGLATNYVGTVDITTDTNNGNWSLSTGSGTLVDINPNDGIATYNFVAADNGSVDIVFTDETIETVNINLDANGIIEDAGFDPDIDVTSCIPGPAGFVPVVLHQTFSGNMNYRAIGNSLRTADNPTACTFFPEATGSTATMDLPAGSTIVSAYVYWAASGTDDPNPLLSDVDDVVNFGPVGSEIDITADDIFLIENPLGLGAGLNFFLGYKEVTGLISTTTPIDYHLSDLTVQNGAPWNGNQTCLGGWGLVVVYDNPLEALHVVNLFHGFQPFQNSAFTLVPRNFRMAAPDFIAGGVPNGQISHITFEGDNSLNVGDEAFRLQNDPMAATFDALTNSFNVGLAQYNNSVSYPVYDGNLDFVPAGGPNGDGYTIGSTTSYGADVDTYYLEGALPGDLLHPFGLGAAEEITTRYSAGQDLVLLAGEFISLVSAPIADLEAFVTQAGTFKVGETGVGSFNYVVTNNGDGTGSSNDSADGEIILTGNLPVGMTINTLTAPGGWDCSLQTTTAFTCIFDIVADWTGGATAGELAAGENLPTVAVTVNVGDETFYPSLSNSVSQSMRIAHTGGGCPAEPAGVQPDPSLCAKSPQFDNVNDLDGGAIDIDDIDDKSSNNNNVDSLLTTVRGIETDLGITKSVVGVLEENQPAQYLLTVTNHGLDATTKTITVTDTLPSGLVPNTAGGTNWTCGISGQDVTCTRALSLGLGAITTITINTNNIASPAIEGANVSNTAVVSAGLYNFDEEPGNNAATDITQVVGQPVASQDKFLISVSENSSIGGLGPFGDGDLVLYDPVTDTAVLFMEENAIAGTTNIGNLNATHVLPNGQILLSSDSDGSSIAGLGFDEGDIVLFDPISGVATLVFDGSTVFTGPADIDAVFVEYNNSYDPNDWDIVLSTVDASVIAGTTYQDNDLFIYDMSAGTASLLVDGANGDVFNGANGDIDAVYIRVDDPDAYILSTDDASTTIAISGTQETYTRDDLVEYNSSTVTGTSAFLGDVANGVFGPASGSRRLDAVHVVEEGYFGHFSIVANDGDTCSATTITIRKHAGLSHAVETDYVGSIRLSTNVGAGTWAKDATANGTLTDQTGGNAIYTFTPGDNGEVILFLTQTIASSNVNVDVTNGISVEDSLEDSTFDIDDIVTVATYRDEFSAISYGNNDGVASFADNWTELNDDSSPNSGAISVSGGKLLMTNPGGPTNRSILRTMDFSSYTPDTASNPLTLTFRWSRANGAPADSFVVEGRSQSTDGWTNLQTFTGLTGGVAENLVSIDMTAQGIVPTASTQIQFRMSGGYVIETISLDDIQVRTATTDCGVGATVDHYAISHSGNGISCLVENVTITAHTAAHLDAVPGTGVTISLNSLTGSTPKGTWFQPNSFTGVFFPGAVGSGNADYNFGALESSVTFPFNYTDISPPTNSEIVVFNVSDFLHSESVTEDPAMTISRAGLRFYNETTMDEIYPDLIAGRASNHPANPHNLVVQAIRASDEDLSMCEPIFSEDALVEVELAFECANPLNCSDYSIFGLDMDVTAIDPVLATSTTIGFPPVSDDATNLAASGGYHPITLRFQTQPSGDIGARIALNYFNAGAMQIHGRYDIQFLDGLGADSGNYMYGSGDNLFVVRPFALDVDFNMNDRRGVADITTANSYANTAFDSTFIDPVDMLPYGAGEPIPTTVTAVLWAPDDDLNNDGIADFEADLSNNAATPNFGNETGFDYEVTLSVITDNPNFAGAGDNPGVPGGVVGNLTQVGSFPSGSGNYLNGASVGAETIAIDEVGIFDIHAVLVDNMGVPLNYLGFEGIEGGVANVGRITPSYFDDTTTLTPRPNFPGPSTSVFTYMGEEFNVEMELVAKNAAGVTTQNYFGDFAKLDAGQLSFFAFEDLGPGPGPLDIDHSSRLSIAPGSFLVDWVSGVAAIDANLIFSRETASGNDGGQQEEPITDVTIAFTAVDTDDIEDGTRDVGIDLDANFTYSSIDTNDFRYGRLRLENAYGSEIPELDGSLNPIGQDVELRIVAEYWFNGEFVVNTDDIGTTYNSTALSFVPDSYETDPDEGNGLDPGEALITPGSGTIFQGGTNEINVTDIPLYFQSPGLGNEGSVVVELDLDALGLSFLEYDWRDEDATEIEDENPNSNFINNPRALIEFGEFRGNDRIINWQELFID